MQAILLDTAEHGIVVARSLHARGIPVTIIADKRWAASTRWAECFLVAQPHRAREAWLERLDELAQRGPGVLISGSDVATEFIVRERERIPSELRSFESPDSAHMALMDKGSLYEIAERAGVRYPWTFRLGSRTDLDRVAEEATYPCLVKPALSHVFRGKFGDRRSILVSGPDELRREVGAPLDAGLELLVNEHVPGPDTNLEGAVTIRKADGEYPLKCGRVKIRMYPPGYGAAAVIESAHAPETMTLTTRLLEEAGFVGISSLEAKVHAETGERILIEINVRLPRPWAVTEVAGTEASWRLYAALAGEPLDEQPVPILRRRAVIPALELRTAAAYMTQRSGSVRGYLSGYRRVDSLSGLSWRDPLPALLLLADFAGWARRFFMKRVRAVTQRPS